MDRQRCINLIRKLYKINPVGSALHIVLDDYNVGTHNIEWSIRHIDDYATSKEEKRLCVEIANLLLALPSETARLSIIREATNEV